ncbi:hypothetical protein GOP80_05925 [Planococcaceae bacterium Storch 2/2-2]|nr:hypothetical protein [Planococcaceae bacterium Storch 2/2-2]
MKRKLSSHDYDVLERELSFLQLQHVIDAETRKEALAHYETKPKTTTVGAIVTIGAVLVAAGVLAWVTSAWALFGWVTQWLILMTSTTGAYILAYFVEKSYPKTGRAIYYAGFGITMSGLAWALHFNPLTPSTVLPLFIAWAAIPLFLALKDPILALVGLGALFTTSFSLWDELWLAFAATMTLIIYFYVNETVLRSSKIVFSGIVGVSLAFILSLTDMYPSGALYVLLVTFIFGTILLFRPLEVYRTISPWLGTIVLAVASIGLTTESVWERAFSIDDGTYFALSAWVLLLLGAFALLKSFQLHSVVLISILIFRLYVDYTYTLIPKSIFFIGAGLLLITLGFWFERSRQRVRGDHDE